MDRQKARTVSEPDRSLFKRLKVKTRNLFKTHPQDRHQLIALLRTAKSHHLLNADALSMMEGVLQVSARQVRDTMVPRTRMVTVNEDASLEDILKTIGQTRHSRFPVLGAEKHDVIGLLLAKDLLPILYENGRDQFNLKSILHPIKLIPESMRLDTLLKEFRLAHCHLAVVIDEYNALAGLVTVEDVVEQIVGDIEDEDYDGDEQEDITEAASGRFHVRGTCSISNFNQFFETTLNGGMLSTIGGLIAREFGYFPSAGEHANIDNLAFSVLQSDSRRVRLLEVTRLENKSTET